MKKIKKMTIAALLTLFVMLTSISFVRPIQLFSIERENCTSIVYLYTGPDWQNQRY